MLECVCRTCKYIGKSNSPPTKSEHNGSHGRRNSDDMELDWFFTFCSLILILLNKRIRRKSHYYFSHKQLCSFLSNGLKTIILEVDFFRSCVFLSFFALIYRYWLRSDVNFDVYKVNMLNQLLYFNKLYWFCHAWFLLRKNINLYNYFNN